MSGKKMLSKLFFLISFLFVSCTANSIVDFEKELLDKGYTEIKNPDFFPAKVKENYSKPGYKLPSYSFELENTDSKNYTVGYQYFFDECGVEMINKYVRVTLIDKDGFYKIYENENINNQKGSPYEFGGVVYDNAGNRIEKPVFYLWD